MNVCFIMYPWENIDPENDTSLALIKECVKRGHGVAMCTPANLTIRNSVTNAFCMVIGRMEKTPNTLMKNRLPTNSHLIHFLSFSSCCSIPRSIGNVMQQLLSFFPRYLSVACLVSIRLSARRSKKKKRAISLLRGKCPKRTVSVTR